MPTGSCHLENLLSGKCLSTFLLLEDVAPTNASALIWPCLLKAVSDKYSCLIVRTESSGKLHVNLSQLSDSVKIIEANSYTDGSACLVDIISEVSKRPTDKQLWMVFLDNMDAFLFDCTSVSCFRQVANQLAALVHQIASSPFVASVVCPMQIYKDPFGWIFGSQELIDAFEYCATTRLRFTNLSKPSSTQPILSISTEFWHRRTLESIFRSAKQVFVPTNKPAISDYCNITVNSSLFSVIDCHSIDIQIPSDKSGAVENLPPATFKLSLSASEIEARQKVTLPYKSKIDYVEETLTHSGSGCIEYNPDTYDDFDDEDPDDDLDI